MLSVFNFGKQILKWCSFEKKKTYFDLLFTFFLVSRKIHKHSFSTHLTLLPKYTFSIELNLFTFVALPILQKLRVICAILKHFQPIFQLDLRWPLNLISSGVTSGAECPPRLLTVKFSLTYREKRGKEKTEKVWKNWEEKKKIVKGKVEIENGRWKS